MTWFMWPSEIEQYERSVFNAYDAFAPDVIQHPGVLNIDETAHFKVLYRDFLIWHNALNWFSWGTGATYQVAESFGKQLKYWRDLYNSRSSVKATGPGVDIIQPLPPTNVTEVVKYVAISAGAAISLTAIAKILRG